MDNSEMVILVGVLALAFALRAVPSAVKGHYGNDAYYHMFTARAVRRDGRLPDKDTGMTPENAFGYPPLLHVLLVPFVGRLEGFALRYLAPALDSLSALVAFMLADELGLAHPIVPAVIVAVSPIAVLQGASLNPRHLGSLALSVALLSGLVFFNEGLAWLLVVAVLSETAVVLSHKMSLQAMLVAHPAAAIAAMAYDPVRGGLLMLVLPCAFALAIAVTRGKYITRTLRDHRGFVGVHRRHGDYATGRKGLPSPVRNLKSDPLSCAGPFLGIWMIVDTGVTGPLAFLLAWAAAMLGIASFWPWGDAWRHLAFGTVPSAALTAMWVETLGLEDAAGWLLVALIISALLGITALQLRRTTAGDQAAWLVSTMESLPQEWKDRLRGGAVYSNLIHYSLPYVLGVKCLGANPNALGMEVNFRLMEAGDRSLEAMAGLAKELTGSEPEYYLLFDGAPNPDEDGFVTAHRGRGLRVMVRKA